MAKRPKVDIELRLIRDSEQNERIESLCRAIVRKESEAKLAKLDADEAREELAVELKKLSAPAYVRGPVRAYVKRRERIVIECDDETGEA